MKERPISISAPMVRALLREENPKTQTRRVVKIAMPNAEIASMHPTANGDGWIAWSPKPVSAETTVKAYASGGIPCPYGKPGDRLYVKEATWLWCERRPNGLTKKGRPKWHYVPMPTAPVFYVADGHKPSTEVVSPETGNKWGWRHKVARFMPRWASRITLEITQVRVERLQDISEADAVAEGIWRPPNKMHWEGSPLTQQGTKPGTPIHAYQLLWEAINGPGSWDANPWVWALTFKQVKP